MKEQSKEKKLQRPERERERENTHLAQRRSLRGVGLISFEHAHVHMRSREVLQKDAQNDTENRSGRKSSVMRAQQALCGNSYLTCEGAGGEALTDSGHSMHSMSLCLCVRVFPFVCPVR